MEFALIAPVFLVLLLGVYEFGHAMHNASSVNYALEEASREIVLTPDLSEAALEQKVLSRLERLSSATVDVTLTRRTVGDVVYADATATYRHALNIPLFASEPIEIRSDVTVLTPA